MDQLNSFCSFCFSHAKKLTYISRIDVNLQEMIRFAVPEYVRHQPLMPKGICHKCLTDLNSIFKFRRKCLKTIDLCNEYIRKLSQQNSASKNDANCNNTMNIKDEPDEPNYGQEMKTESFENYEYDSALVSQNETPAEMEEVTIKVENAANNFYENEELMQAENSGFGEDNESSCVEFIEEHCYSTSTRSAANQDNYVPSFDVTLDSSSDTSFQNAEKILCTPTLMSQEADNSSQNLLTKRSREVYAKHYEKFETWCKENNVVEITESAVVAYFEKESKYKKPTSLWAKYSMLKACLSTKRNVDLSKFTRLSELLKEFSEGYEPKQSKILEIDDINRFIREAHNRTYLGYKVILIVGYSGACRRDELTNLKMDDVEFEKDSILVSISKTKNSIQRQFVITDKSWIELIGKYIALRPLQLNHGRFFITYRNGHCLSSPIGINTIGRVPKEIAAFLELSNPELYTGHCFRRSSITQQGRVECDPLAVDIKETKTDCNEPEMRQGPKAASTLDSLLSLKSRETYEKGYECFDNWRQQNNVEEITESALIAYFDKESKEKKSSTLLAKYSMLRTCLNVYNNIDISQFANLTAFLKTISEGYEPKQTKILEKEDIDRFITEADDTSYLAHKVILIIGYSGAFRRDEITNLKLDYMKFKENVIVVSIPKTKTCFRRHFIITDKSWVDLVKKYVSLRPKDITHRRFFITYRRGYCVNCPIGINKMGQVPKEIATFLNLPNPELFTGHCFRRSNGVAKVKRQRGWKSSAALSSNSM